MLQALADPYFNGLSSKEREPSTQPISKLEFEFERKKLTKDDIRELIYREVMSLLYLFFGFDSPIFVILMDYLKNVDIRVSSSDAGGIPSWWQSAQLHVPQVR